MNATKIVQCDYMVSDCEWSAATGVLHLEVNYRFPKNLTIHSERTGKSIQFMPVPYGHKLFDEDQWDGEMQVYIPVNPDQCEKVSHLVAYPYQG